MVFSVLAQEIMEPEIFNKKQNPDENGTKQQVNMQPTQLVVSNTKNAKNVRKLENQFPGKNIGHWHESQKFQYYIFLQKHKIHFLNRELRRTDKIFKQMSKFLQTRAADQCRSHHQKMEKKYKTFQCILDVLRSNYFKQIDQELLKQNDEITKNGSPRPQSMQTIVSQEYFTQYLGEKLNQQDNIKQEQQYLYILPERLQPPESFLLSIKEQNNMFINYDIDKFLF